MKTKKSEPPQPLEALLVVPALAPTVVSSYQELRNQAGKLEEQISDRIDYILKHIYQTFGYSLQYWYFEGAEEGGAGDVCSNLDKDSINSLCPTPYIPSHDFAIINKHGEEWGLADSIPTRWLFESFEKEVEDGKKLYEETSALEAAKKKEKSLQREAKKEKALKKLSPEDRKLLGLD